jgi:hypothetical protein
MHGMHRRRAVGTGERMKPKPLRDRRGRFVKAKAPPLPEALVRSLGTYRRPEILMVADHELVVRIKHPKLPDPDEPVQEASTDSPC